MEGRPPGADLLTRTTLQMDVATAAADAEHVTRLLRSVPGVLLADFDPGNARAVIAHDAGVRLASLVAAAGRAGVRARVVDDVSRPVSAIVNAPALRAAWSRQVLMVLMPAFVCITLLEIVLPKDKGGVVAALVVSLVMFLSIETLIRRRPS